MATRTVTDRLLRVIGLLLLALAAIPVALSAQSLAWSPLALNRAYVVAQGMTNEVVLCGSAQLDGDSLRVTDLLPVYMRTTDTAFARGDPCPIGTVVVWHNHPWSGPMPEAGVTKPAELCSLGRTDRVTAIGTGAPWIAVSVGRGDANYTWLCWWNRAQLDLLPLSLPALEGQRLKYWSR
jgi:hypothetical protein